MRARSARLKVGVNYPWKNYGWDFGEGPWGMRRAWENDLVGELRALRGLGVGAVRWFILGDGLTYGIRHEAPARDATQRWRFIPPVGAGVEEILKDCRALLERFRIANRGLAQPITLMPVLLDFHMMYPGNFECDPTAGPTARVQPPPSGFVKNGRADVVADTAGTRRYLEGFLEPLIAMMREDGYRELVHSVDLFNEPEWCTDAREGDPRWTISAARMRRFLVECAEMVTPHFPSTVGFARHETLSKWDVRAMALSSYQFHYYGQPRVIPHADPDVRCIVGEFASASGRPLATPWMSALLGQFRKSPGDRTWNDLDGPGGDQSVGARLETLDRKGYPEAFVWSLHAVDRATLWTSEVEREIRDFVTGE